MLLLLALLLLVLLLLLVRLVNGRGRDGKEGKRFDQASKALCEGHEAEKDAACAFVGGKW
jgi:hypothetical protein